MDDTGRQSAGNLLGWLAGFIDADGMIGIHRQPTSAQTVTYVPEVAVTTTCLRTADHLSAVFEAIDVPVYRQLRKVTKPNWSDRHALTIRGMKRVSKILPLILPYLVTKQGEAEMLMEFITSRRSQSPREPYRERELALIAAIKAAKRERHK